MPRYGSVGLRVILKKGRDKPIRDRHPWVFSGSVARIEGAAPPGSLADICDHDGRFLARGYANRRSRIVARVLSREAVPIDRTFLATAITRAQALRRDLIGDGADAYRLIHGEGDLLPGLVVDRYGDGLVCQLNTAGVDLMRDLILDVLEEVVAPAGIWERSEAPARRDEGCQARTGHARGVEPAELVVIREGETRFAIDLRRGHKTGFYLDQRAARGFVRRHAGGRRVLDVFAFSGAFSVSAVAGGAREVTAIDTSERDLALVGRHLEANGAASDAVRCVVDDAFQALRRDRSAYDLIVVDPPAFAKRRAEVDGACRGYKDVNLHAMRRLAPGGLLVTSSCSHHVDAKLFQQVLFAAAKDASCELQIVRRFGHGADHPVSIDHPEGEYLKTLVLRRLR